MNNEILDVSNTLLDPRFKEGLELFNSSNWYKAHDVFEELWHETIGPERTTLQGILQVAVAQVHLESGNLNGATILYGEGLGRLRKSGNPDLGLDIQGFCSCLEVRLKALQCNEAVNHLDIPYLKLKS